MYLIALVPLIVYGFYKNGFKLFLKGIVGVDGLFRPMLILAACLVGSLFGGFLREWFKNRKSDKKINFINSLKGNVVEAVLVAAILPINTQLSVAVLVPALFSLFFDKLKLNKIALMYIAIESINVFLGLNNFDNVYEASTVLNYTGVDYFFGSGTGGIFSTSILFIIVGFIFLCFNKLYKREMVVASLLSFLLLAVGSCMIRGAYSEIFPFIFGYNIMFAFVFIAPNLYSSSYTVKGQITSGILIGVGTFIIFYFTHYTAAVLAILIVSVFKGVLDRIFVIK